MKNMRHSTSGCGRCGRARANAGDEPIEHGAEQAHQQHAHLLVRAAHAAAEQQARRARTIESQAQRRTDEGVDERLERRHTCGLERVEAGKPLVVDRSDQALRTASNRRSFEPKW
jgi:hypothetical protein